jgi:alpha/beta superfamily hydrolase
MPKIKVNRSKIEQTKKKNEKWKNHFFNQKHNRVAKQVRRTPETVKADHEV